MMKFIFKLFVFSFFSFVVKMSWFGLVSLFKWHINLCRLFNAKDILLEEQLFNYLTDSWEDKRVHTFPKGIYPKVNVIARLEYELAFYDSAVHCFNHYTTRTPPKWVGFEVTFSHTYWWKCHIGSQFGNFSRRLIVPVNCCKKSFKKWIIMTMFHQRNSD